MLVAVVIAVVALWASLSLALAFALGRGIQVAESNGPVEMRTGHRGVVHIWHASRNLV